MRERCDGARVRPNPSGAVQYLGNPPAVVERGRHRLFEQDVVAWIGIQLKGVDTLTLTVRSVCGRNGQWVAFEAESRHARH